MKRFSERNPVIIGTVGIAVTASLLALGFQFDKIPFMSSGKTYRAYFADASALRSGAEVQVSGYRVGQVSAIKLEGTNVLVEFKINDNIRLGDRTEAAIKTETLLGTKIVSVTSRGDGELSQVIPLERTTTPYQLPDALGDLTMTISGLNTDQVSDSLATLAQTFQNTAPDLKGAVQGVSRISETINARDAQLRNLLVQANKATTVLAERTDQVVALIANANALLAELQSQSTALDNVSGHISAVSQQLSGFIDENREQLHPALDKLNEILTIVDDRKDKVQKSISLLHKYAMSLGESVAGGPFFKAYIANLLPGQFVQPFVDAAFSDLGLDPSVLLPSQLTDPQTGQPATPALPSPFPRTGQGGEPRLTLPEAITGNPGDPRYPYREPPPPPPPGGPPPGPPLPDITSTPEPTPQPVHQPAPGEVAPGVPLGPASPPTEGPTP
jgi:phospholipid/cholesterol/gamma-HCH transport system substrate-binding protein